MSKSLVDKQCEALYLFFLPVLTRAIRISADGPTTCNTDGHGGRVRPGGGCDATAVIQCQSLPQNRHSLALGVRSGLPHQGHGVELSGGPLRSSTIRISLCPARGLRVSSQLT